MKLVILSHKYQFIGEEISPVSITNVLAFLPCASFPSSSPFSPSHSTRRPSGKKNSSRSSIGSFRPWPIGIRSRSIRSSLRKVCSTRSRSHRRKGRARFRTAVSSATWGKAAKNYWSATGSRRFGSEMGSPPCEHRTDFHADGKFSHCGIDVFNLVRMPDGWKISGGMFTMQREGCAESPLGVVE